MPVARGSLGVVDDGEDRLYRGQLQQSLDALAPSYDGEFVPVLVRKVVLADQPVESLASMKVSPRRSRTT